MEKKGLAKDLEELYVVFCLILAIITMAGSLIVFFSKAPWIPPKWSAIIIIGLATSVSYIWAFTKRKITLYYSIGALLFVEWGALFALFKTGFLR